MAKTRKRRKHRFLRNVFNPKGWMGYDSVKDSGHEVANMFRDITESREPVRSESFDQAMKRMKLSEEDIQARMKWLYIGSWIYFTMATLVVLYALVCLFTMKLLTALICGIVAVLGYALAFRESFFYFQMKKRKLGCTVKEWTAFILRKEKISKSTSLKK